MTTKIRIRSIATRTRKAWVVVGPNGYPMLDSIKARRTHSKSAIEQLYNSNWRNLRKEGYRIEKINLSPS
jgi:hypothetical protein